MYDVLVDKLQGKISSLRREKNRTLVYLLTQRNQYFRSGCSSDSSVRTYFCLSFFYGIFLDLQLIFDNIVANINLPLFSTVLPSNSCCFCPVGLSLLKQHYQQVLWVLKLLLSPGDRNIHILEGTTVENKGKLILTNLPIGAKHDI